MEYEAQLAPMDKSAVTPSGFLEPLCTKCCSVDCTNPIQEMTVSVAGIVKKYRLWVDHNIIKQVVSCKGYVDSDVSLEN